MTKKLKIDQQLYFEGEKLPMRVEAISTSKRYVICTRKLDIEEDKEDLLWEVKMERAKDIDEAYENLRKYPIYSILDIQQKIRGAINNPDGYSFNTNSDFQKIFNDLEVGKIGISDTNRCKLVIMRITEWIWKKR